MATKICKTTHINADLFTLLNDWPTVPGTITDTSQVHHSWFKSIATTVKNLSEKVEKLEENNIKLTEEITSLRRQLTPDTNNVPTLMSHLFKDNSTLIKVVKANIATEMTDRTSIENNVIIRGILECLLEQQLKLKKVMNKQ
jgi:hypothetical protein